MVKTLTLGDAQFECHPHPELGEVIKIEVLRGRIVARTERGISIICATLSDDAGDQSSEPEPIKA